MVICQNLDVVQIWYPFLHAVSYEVVIQLEVISSLESVLTSPTVLFFYRGRGGRGRGGFGDRG